MLTGSHIETHVSLYELWGTDMISAVEAVFLFVFSTDSFDIILHSLEEFHFHLNTVFHK